MEIPPHPKGSGLRPSPGWMDVRRIERQKPPRAREKNPGGFAGEETSGWKGKSPGPSGRGEIGAAVDSLDGKGTGGRFGFRWKVTAARRAATRSMRRPSSLVFGWRRERPAR